MCFPKFLELRYKNQSGFGNEYCSKSVVSVGISSVSVKLLRCFVEDFLKLSAPYFKKQLPDPCIFVLSFSPLPSNFSFFNCSSTTSKRDVILGCRDEFLDQCKSLLDSDKALS